MISQPELRRSTVNLAGSAFPVISDGRKSWLFAPAGPVPLPTPLLQVPRFLAWLLQGHIRPLPSDVLGVTVIPQMGCNAACGYCIQNISTTPNGVQRVRAAWMSDATMAATAAFIERQRVDQGRASVALNIFGGEPLLNPKRCYNLLERVAHISSASIVTNAVLLTPAIATRLTDLGVGNIQVTFDGARQDHDSVRVLAADGGGTYDTIVDNLIAIDALPVLADRQLRVNVTRSNLAGLSELVHDLAKKLTPDRWMLYFALVDDNNIGWNDGLQPGESAGVALANLARLTASLGFPPPVPRGGDCALCDQSFGKGGMVINADGKLSSCWDTAGFPHMVVGDVWNGYVPAEGNENKWVRCGYRSTNKGFLTEEHVALSELAWTLRELTVQQ